jgi:hypothetical protein
VATLPAADAGGKADSDCRGFKSRPGERGTIGAWRREVALAMGWEMGWVGRHEFIGKPLAHDVERLTVRCQRDTPGAVAAAVIGLRSFDATGLPSSSFSARSMR